MSVGISFDKQFIGVSIIESGSNFQIKNIFSDQQDSNIKQPVIGLPIQNFTIKNIFLPNVSKAELENTIKLQKEYNFGKNEAVEFKVNHAIKKTSTGYLLLLISGHGLDSKKNKPKAVIPEPLALYSIARLEKLIDDKQNYMLLYFKGEEIILLVTMGYEVVFMRSFHKNSNLATEIKLSAQAVYLQYERFILNVNKFVIFSQNELDKKTIQNILPNSEMVWINIEKYQGPNKTDLFIPIGLALFNNHLKSYSYWNVAKPPLSKTESLKKFLRIGVIIALVMFPLFLYMNYYSSVFQINKLKKNLRKSSNQLNEINSIEQKLAQISNFMKLAGNPVLTYTNFYELLNIIDKSRTDDIKLASVTGKPSDEIVVSGFTNSFSNISLFIKNLNASRLIKTLSLNYSSESGELGKNVAFQLTLKINEQYYTMTDNKKSDTAN